MKFYAITPSPLKDNKKTILLLKKYLSLGVNYIELRDKELIDSSLLKISKRAVQLTKNTETKIIVNKRADIALISGAYGVHLESNSFSPKFVKENFKGLKVFKSCHNEKEIFEAIEEGVDALTISPIFDTKKNGKIKKGIGFEILKKIPLIKDIEIFALGGINKENIFLLKDYSITGIAGITFFTTVKKKIFKKIREELN